MADSASESDTGSLDGGGFQPPSPVSREQLQKRIESLQQQNRVLSVELETYKLRVKSLQVGFYFFLSNIGIVLLCISTLPVPIHNA
jgi:Uncharacterized conserved protein H4 (DUF2046)